MKLLTNTPYTQQEIIDNLPEEYGANPDQFLKTCKQKVLICLPCIIHEIYGLPDISISKVSRQQKYIINIEAGL